MRPAANESARHAASVAGATPAPAAVPPVSPETDPADWKARPAATFSHLAACPACGSLNGHSAPSCWNCEASLAAVDSSQMWPAVDLVDEPADTGAETLVAAESAFDPGATEAAPPAFGVETIHADDLLLPHPATPGRPAPPSRPAAFRSDDPWAAAVPRLPSATDPPYPVLTRWIERHDPGFEASRPATLATPRDAAQAAHDAAFAPRAPVLDPRDASHAARDAAFAQREQQELALVTPRDTVAASTHAEYVAARVRNGSARRLAPGAIAGVVAGIVLLGAAGTAAYLYARSPGIDLAAPGAVAVDAAAPATRIDSATVEPSAAAAPQRSATLPVEPRSVAAPVAAPAAAPVAAPAAAPVTATAMPVATAAPAPVVPPASPSARPAPAPAPALTPAARVPAAAAALPANPTPPLPAAAVAPPAAPTLTPSLSPCTATVAALGLCTMPPNSPKE